MILITVSVQQRRTIVHGPIWTQTYSQGSSLVIAKLIHSWSLCNSTTHTTKDCVLNEGKKRKKEFVKTPGTPLFKRQGWGKCSCHWDFTLHCFAAWLPEVLHLQHSKMHWQGCCNQLHPLILHLSHRWRDLMTSQPGNKENLAGEELDGRVVSSAFEGGNSYAISTNFHFWILSSSCLGIVDSPGAIRTG